MAIKKTIHRMQSIFVQAELIIIAGMLANSTAAEAVSFMGAETQSYVIDQCDSFVKYQINNPAWRR